MAWSVAVSKILQPAEIAAVLNDLRRKSRGSLNARTNRIVFRLATCCGLRASEIAGLTLADVQIDNSRPSISVRSAIAKRHKARRVPLTWDAETLADMTEWKRFRESQGVAESAPFVCSQHRDSAGHPLERTGLRRRFLTCCKPLGAERVRQLTIHSGRHSFISHALNGGRNILQVRDAAGHSSLATTSLYAHLVENDDGIGSIFNFSKEPLQ